MLAAAAAGEIDIEEAESYALEAERLGRLLSALAEGVEIDQRLADIELATREAVKLTVELIQMTEWMEEAESVTMEFNTDDATEYSADILASLSPEEAIYRLQVDVCIVYYYYLCNDYEMLPIFVLLGNLFSP